MTNLIKDRLKEVIEILNSIKINDLSYFSTKKNYNVSKYSLSMVFLKDIYEKKLSVNDTGGKQGIFYSEIKNKKSKAW